MTVTGVSTMYAEIKKKEKFIVAVCDKKSMSPSICSEVWKELYNKYSHNELAKLGKGKSVGVTHDSSTTEKINYLTGYIVDDISEAEKMGLNILEINEAEYAIIELTGSVLECIGEGWKYALEVLLP